MSGLWQAEESAYVVPILCRRFVECVYHLEKILNQTIEIYESWRARDAEAKDMARLGEGTSDNGIEEQRLNEEKAK
jgi:hypothetical protein